LTTEPLATSPAHRPDAAPFPTDFTWGAATSSFQIEGASVADGKGASIWDVFCRQEGAVADGTNGDIACDHYHRFGDDIALMAELGLGAYRFSIAWPRVFPSGTGEINPAGLDFYDRLVDTLLAAEIDPFATLYHWDLPQALEEEGGWRSRATAYAFADYTEPVVERLGDRIAGWATLNEPFVSANHGYVTGEHAPGRTSMLEGMAASHHLLLGHGLALERIRAIAPGAEVGIVLNFTPTEPDTESAADLAETQRVDDLENRWYIDPIAGRGYPAATARSEGWHGEEVHDGDMSLIAAPIDVLGVNYYTRQVVSAIEGHAPERSTAKTDMGWDIHPASFRRLLRELQTGYDFPKYMITENGCAMPDTARTADGRVDDIDRIDYYRAHLAQVSAAIADGMPVAGYFAWSLMDNFEWAHGYAKRFGIVEVDFDTLERRPKRSALWYADVAATGSLPDPHAAADGSISSTA
jgi:beta-glucosidase